MNFILDFIKGIFVGVANIIPGVSGGTMAVSFGIYDKLLSSISNLFKDFKNCFKNLLPIALGMVIGVATFTFIIPWLLENQPFITSMAFTGLILGGVPMTIKGQQDGYMRDKNKSQIVNVILFIIFAAIALAMTFMSGDSESGIILTADAITILKMFFLGIIAAATMVIPGVSGSLVLMILGYYFGIITAVKDFLSALKDFDFEKLFNLSLLLVPFGVGCILGIFFISKLISWMFNHFASATYSAILGLIITAPISIFYKVNDEYGLSSTTIPQIILSVIILAACIAGTLYMGNLETSDDKEAKQYYIMTKTKKGL